MRKANSPTLHRAATPLKPTQRSRVTNGRALFVTGSGGDGRNPWARRFRDIISLHVSDLQGADNCSAAELSIIRRIAALTVELERIEAKFAVGEGDDKLDVYQRAASAQRRLLESIGLQRRSREVQTLDQYLAENYRDEETASEVGGESEPEPGSHPPSDVETLASGLLRPSAEPSP